MPEKGEEGGLIIRLTIRSGGVETSVEGTTSKIEKELKALVTLHGKAVKAIAEEGVGGEEGVAPSSEVEQTTEVPVIKVTNSTADNIISLFETPWGRRPRSRSEVMQALEMNGAPASIENTGMALLKGVRSGKLRRIRRGGSWQYYRLPP
jgi:hypothetical protein